MREYIARSNHGLFAVDVWNRAEGRKHVEVVDHTFVVDSMPMPPYAIRGFPTRAAQLRVAAIASIAMDEVLRNDLRSIFYSDDLKSAFGKKYLEGRAPASGAALSEDLELQPGCELDQARVVGIRRRSDLTIQCVAKLCSRVGELCCVQHVECFCTELQLQVLIDVEALEERQVYTLQSRAVELIAALIAHRVHTLELKVRRVEPRLMVGCATLPEPIMFGRSEPLVPGREPLRLVKFVTENGMPVFQTMSPFACHPLPSMPRRPCRLLPNGSE